MDRNHLYKESRSLIDTFLDQEYATMAMEQLNKEETLIIVVDMINGFAKAGALYSNRVEQLIHKQSVFLSLMYAAEKLFLCDAHPVEAEEFKIFPSHCLAGTEEAEIVDELKAYAQTIIYKNSTNGYLEKTFQQHINRKTYKDIIIIGCCTDLCVQQLAITLKTHYHVQGEAVNVIVPVDLVETYDLQVANHPGDFMHLMALKMMQDNGIMLRVAGEIYDMVK